MKKKLFILAAAALFALSGCASSKDDTEAGENTQQETTDNTGTTDEQAQAEYEQYKAYLLGGGDEFPQLTEPKEGEEIVVLKTSMGDITIKLCPEEAPKACENFIQLCKDGYYDGITFHRVIDGFMIQGGDPSGNGTGGESIYGGKFDDEFSPNMYHFRGALAMANSGANTNGSQFYIVQKDKVTDGYFDQVDSINKQYGTDEILYNSGTGKIFKSNYSDEARKNYEELGGTPELDYGYTVFGMVIDGMDVVDSIAKVETDSSDKPAEPVTIDSVEIVEYVKN